eukprot:scaffold30712_cov46-Attheya_sp.AAC.1
MLRPSATKSQLTTEGMPKFPKAPRTRPQGNAKSLIAAIRANSSSGGNRLSQENSLSLRTKTPLWLRNLTASNCKAGSGGLPCGAVWRPEVWLGPAAHTADSPPRSPTARSWRPPVRHSTAAHPLPMTPAVVRLPMLPPSSLQNATAPPEEIRRPPWTRASVLEMTSIL